MIATPRLVILLIMSRFATATEAQGLALVTLIRSNFATGMETQSLAFVTTTNSGGRDPVLSMAAKSQYARG